MYLVTKFDVYEIVSPVDEHGRTLDGEQRIRAKSQRAIVDLLAAVFPAGRIIGPLLPDADHLAMRVSLGPRPRVIEFPFIEVDGVFCHAIEIEERWLLRFLRVLARSVNYADTSVEVTQLHGSRSEHSTLVHRVLMDNRLRIAKRKP